MSTRSDFSNYKKVSIIIILLIILIGVEIFAYLRTNKGDNLIDNLNTNTAFNISDWLEMKDEKNKLSFKYPARLSASYISVVDWPPQIKIYNPPLTCNEAGIETARGGKTEKRSVGSRSYCVTKISEGAAGSIYDLYAYAIQRDNKVIIMSFSTKSPQCANFSDFQKVDCEKERETFNLDLLVDQIFRTIKFTK